MSLKILLFLVSIQFANYVTSEGENFSGCRGGKTFNGKCYILIRDKQLSFYYADKECQKQYGARLAIIRSCYEQDFISKTFFYPNKPLEAGIDIILININ